VNADRRKPAAPAPPRRCYSCGEPLIPGTCHAGFVGDFCPVCWEFAQDTGVSPSTLKPFTPRSD